MLGIIECVMMHMLLKDCSVSGYMYFFEVFVFLLIGLKDSSEYCNIEYVFLAVRQNVRPCQFYKRQLKIVLKDRSFFQIVFLSN